MVHELKVWPKDFKDIFDLKKTFEVRKNDKNFKVNDVLLLKEWDNKHQVFTGAFVTRDVTSILHDPKFGVKKGYCIMSIKRFLKSENKSA
jgi:hypothetical protein